MENIPEEIISLFFNYLNPVQAQKLSLVNKKLNKPYIVIEYETLCQQQDRIQYLSDKLKTLDITNLKFINANTVKQSKDREHYESCFKKYHVREFIKDYPSIKHLTTYEF